MQARNRITFIAIGLSIGLGACGGKPAEAPAAQETTAPVELAEEAPVETSAPADTTDGAFHQELELLGVHFVVEASNAGSVNTLTVTPSGLTEANDVIVREVDGVVTSAEIADINADGSPEIYVWAQSAGSGSYALPIGFSGNNNKSLSDISFPSVSDDPINGKGYRGHDEFAVVEGVIVQRFPLYAEGDTNAAPTGKTRQLQYKLTQGEASWVMKLDRVMDF